MNTVWALCVLAGMAAPGVAALWRWRRRLGLAPLEAAAFGIPLGAVVSSLGLLAVAVAFGFNVVAVWLVIVLAVMGAAALWGGGGEVPLTPPAPLPPVATWGRGELSVEGTPLKLTRRTAPSAISLGVVAPSSRLPATVARRLAVSPSRFGWVPIVVIGAFAVRWAFLWSDVLTYEQGNLVAGHINIWGDWAQHIGDVNSFVSGDNFPPEHPRYTGVSYAYHYLASFTAAAMVETGMGVTQALTLHSFLFSVVTALCVYAFARRLTRDSWAAALGMTIFFLGGGVAWLLTVAEADRSHSLWDVPRDRPWDGSAATAANYEWQNVYFASIEPQRAFLYGLPLCLLVFTLLHSAVDERGEDGKTGRREENRHPERSEGSWPFMAFVADRDASSMPTSPKAVNRQDPSLTLRMTIHSPSPRLPVFAAAGAVAGLLPFAHLGPLPLLAMVTLCLFALFPSWGWVVFGLAWVGLTVPQLLLQGDGGGETFSSFRTQIGWIADPDPWWWFWLKNLGWFGPILIVGFLDRSLFTPVSRRVLWAFMPVFAVANLYVFQPDAWDNTKLLTYWFLAGAIVVGAVIVKAWRRNPAPAIRLAIAAVTLSLLLSGLLVNLDQAEGHDRNVLLTGEELDLAARVRAETPADALFAVGLQHNHPVPMMGGRRVVMSYPGWLWPRGIDSSGREADLRAIYRLAPEAPALMAAYGIDYLVIGPWERQNFAADPVAWRARYPVAIETPSYLIFRLT